MGHKLCRADMPILTYKGVLVARVPTASEAYEYQAIMEEVDFNAARALRDFAYFSPSVRAALHHIVGIQIFEQIKGALPNDPATIEKKLKMIRAKTLLDFS